LSKEYKSFVEFKFLEGGTGGFEGYGSLFGILDDGGDVVEAGAFAEAIPQFLKEGFISLGHDWDGLAIGTVADAREDARGLYIRTEYHSTADAQDARKVAQERIARGKSVGLSIGYSVAPENAAVDADGVRHLTKINRLFEVAQVNVPMLRPAGLIGVKGYGVPFDVHSDEVRVALAEWLERVRSGSDLRAEKAGRAISESRRLRIAAVRESLLAGAGEIEALLKETEPPAAVVEAVVEAIEETPKALPSSDVLRLREQFLELAAKHPALT
jgi:HK97 family phage prohead protease